MERIAGLGKCAPARFFKYSWLYLFASLVASVGLTQKLAEDAGHKVRVGHFPFIGNGKAIALGETDGFVKTVLTRQPGVTWGS